MNEYSCISLLSAFKVIVIQSTHLLFVNKYEYMYSSSNDSINIFAVFAKSLFANLDEDAEGVSQSSAKLTYCMEYVFNGSQRSVLCEPTPQIALSIYDEKAATVNGMSHQECDLDLTATNKKSLRGDTHWRTQILADGYFIHNALNKVQRQIRDAICHIFVYSLQGSPRDGCY